MVCIYYILFIARTSGRMRSWLSPSKVAGDDVRSQQTSKCKDGFHVSAEIRIRPTSLFSVDVSWETRIVHVQRNRYTLISININNMTSSTTKYAQHSVKRHQSLPNHEPSLLSAWMLHVVITLYGSVHHTSFITLPLSASDISYPSANFANDDAQSSAPNLPFHSTIDSSVAEVFGRTGG